MWVMETDDPCPPATKIWEGPKEALLVPFEALKMPYKPLRDLPRPSGCRPEQTPKAAFQTPSARRAAASLPLLEFPLSHVGQVHNDSP